MSDTLINLTDSVVVTEEELLLRAREGDRTAFGTLYLRHRDAARKVAGMCASSSADADDAVAEGFARVFAALPRMAGRTIAFRPYLLTCVRNAATDRLRRERRIDLRESLPETPGGLQADDMALLGLERNLVGEALQALPARWRTVLWLTEVEGLSPAEVSNRIGIKPNAVAALAYRARKGLREAYLQAHLRAEASVECRATVSRLGNYVRAELNEKDRLTVQAHLDECAKCRCRRDELTDVNATLRNALLPVPLLLKGVSRRIFDLGQAGTSQWLAKAPDLSQAAQLADSPFVHKAVAGISMVVLAISGSTVPKLMESHRGSGDGAEVAAAAPTVAVPERALRQVDVAPLPDPVPTTTHVPAVTVPHAGGPASPAHAQASAQAAPPPEASVPGGTRKRFFPWLGGSNAPSQDPDRSGQTRHKLIQPSDGSEPEGNLLADGPVAGVLESTLGTVAELPLPVHLGVTLPVPGVSTTGAPLGLGVSVGDRSSAPVGLDINLGPTSPPATTTSPPATTTTTVPEAAPPTPLVDGLLRPVTEILGLP
jgi:RNA polymerase sigma factor (sigma-70 family)